jgi:hypothetical protein
MYYQNISPALIITKYIHIYRVFCFYFIPLLPTVYERGTIRTVPSVTDLSTILIICIQPYECTID